MDGMVVQHVTVLPHSSKVLGLILSPGCYLCMFSLRLLGFTPGFPVSCQEVCCSIVVQFPLSVNVCAYCEAMDWYTSQDIFLPRTNYSWDRL